MKKPDIARRMARAAKVTEAEAADRLDRMVHQILSRLKEGKEAPLPGLGTFLPHRNGTVRFQKETPRKNG
jgi:nucleoid DNA-binding protein